MPKPTKPASERQGHRTKAEQQRGLRLLPGAEKPAEEDARPPAPRGLRKMAREIWDAYWSSPVAKAADRRSDGFRFQRWIWDVNEYIRVRPVLVRALLVKGSTGQPVLNPLHNYLAELARRIDAAEVEFGMTPKARASLGLTIGQERLTVEHLNRMLDGGDWSSGGQDDNDEPEPNVVDGQWEEA